MSLKIRTFTSIITQPLNTHNFEVSIPEFGFDAVVVAANFPTDKMRQMKLHYKGEEVRYPTIPSNTGEWAFKVPENDDGKIYRAFKEMRGKLYDQRSGLLTPQKWVDIEVVARDLADNQVFSVVLHGCWILGRNDVALDNKSPETNWEWDFQFVYQWIEDKHKV